LAKSRHNNSIKAKASRSYTLNYLTLSGLSIAPFAKRGDKIEI
jgi:hypothetical protein